VGVGCKCRGECDGGGIVGGGGCDLGFSLEALGDGLGFGDGVGGGLVQLWLSLVFLFLSKGMVIRWMERLRVISFVWLFGV